jgi:hypothetical protein
MATISRNISTTPFAVGTYVQTANVGAFKVVCQNTSDAAQDLRNETGTNEVIQMILHATNALGYTIADANTGVVTLLVDNSQWDAASLQVAIRQLGSVTGDDSTSIDLTGSDVTAAATVTAA